MYYEDVCTEKTIRAIHHCTLLEILNSGCVNVGCSEGNVRIANCAMNLRKLGDTGYTGIGMYANNLLPIVVWIYDY